ncbi:MAG: hypothetical protein IJE07_10860 [Clostridia bacterium]|nr:hypothetical protein [Clostridia bacterium]
MKHRLLALLLVLVMLAIPAAADANITVSAGHILLEDKDMGPCKQLTGSVEVVVLIVSTGDEPWTEAEITAIRQEAQTACRMLRTEASIHGADLTLSLKFHTVSVDEVDNMNGSDAWVDKALSKASGLHGTMHGTAWSNTPLLIFVSTPGRAYAVSQYADYFAEYAVLYRGDDSAVIRHEMMHLFGAQDYYVEETIAAAAERLCPNSIMLSSDYSGTVDELTAYTVGWTEEPGSVARQMLEETASVTPEGYIQSQADNQITGLGTTSDADTTYNGMLVNGVSQGWGHMTWKNGDSYLGYWQQGQRDGKGMYFWADGTLFAGDFTCSKRTGWGVTLWPDGTSYVGDYLEGARHGRGVYTWADGSVYSGDFVNGQRTGQGTLINASGSVYTGGFLDGEYSGHGTLVFTDGSSYTGGFLNGRLHGTGIYIWANGSSFTGSFANGMRHGHGVYHSETGSLLEGEWVNNEYVQ